MSRLIFAPDETIHAPRLIDLEVTQVLRRYVQSGVLSADRGSEAVAALADFPLTRYSHSFLLHRIWQMRHNVTAYDVAYLALAEAPEAPLVTRDSALAKFGGQVRVEVV